MSPRVSVVMTVFNGVEHVAEAVESILFQSFSDFEFLIIDNASTDGTVALLKKYSDPRIRLILNESNLGQTKALNRGISASQGEFMARMDADDISLPARLGAQVDYLNAHPRVGVVGSWHDEIDESGRHLKLMKYPSDPLEVKCHLLSDGNLTKRCVAHPTVMFRSAVLLEMGGYDETIKYAQDYELWTRLISKYDIANIPQSLLKYRVSRKSTSNLHRQDMTMELDRIVSAHVARLLPSISKKNEKILCDMLRNRNFSEKVSASDWEILFDHLFQSLFSPSGPDERALRIREQIKVYYLPRLLLTTLWGRLLRRPDIWFDSKLHKNFLKVMVNR